MKKSKTYISADVNQSLTRMILKEQLKQRRLTTNIMILQPMVWFLLSFVSMAAVLAFKDSMTPGGFKLIIRGSCVVNVVIFVSWFIRVLNVMFNEDE